MDFSMNFLIDGVVVEEPKTWRLTPRDTESEFRVHHRPKLGGRSHAASRT